LYQPTDCFGRVKRSAAKIVSKLIYNVCRATLNPAQLKRK